MILYCSMTTQHLDTDTVYQLYCTSLVESTLDLTMCILTLYRTMANIIVALVPIICRKIIGSTKA